MGIHCFISMGTMYSFILLIATSTLTTKWNVMFRFHGNNAYTNAPHCNTQCLSCQHYINLRDPFQILKKKEEEERRRYPSLHLKNFVHSGRYTLIATINVKFRLSLHFTCGQKDG
jgi:hypothetical protein